MAIDSEIADGLNEIETDFPATFIWTSTSYKCIAGSESRAVSAGDFGLENVDNLTLIVQLGQFGTGTKPNERSKITFNSRNYRIETIDTAPSQAFVVYRCVRSR